MCIPEIKVKVRCISFHPFLCSESDLHQNHPIMNNPSVSPFPFRLDRNMDCTWGGEHLQVAVLLLSPFTELNESILLSLLSHKDQQLRSICIFFCLLDNTGMKQNERCPSACICICRCARERGGMMWLIKRNYWFASISWGLGLCIEETKSSLPLRPRPSVGPFPSLLDSAPALDELKHLHFPASNNALICKYICDDCCCLDLPAGTHNLPNSACNDNNKAWWKE